jgi:hypothetical protein
MVKEKAGGYYVHFFYFFDRLRIDILRLEAKYEPRFVLFHKCYQPPIGILQNIIFNESQTGERANEPFHQIAGIDDSASVIKGDAIQAKRSKSSDKRHREKRIGRTDD